MDVFETFDHYRDFAELKEFRFNDERYSTVTSREQHKTESSIEKCFDRFQQLQFLDPKSSKILRDEHQRYLEAMLHNLPVNYECLDSSRPWNVYWILQAAHTLNFTFSDEVLDQVVEFLVRCRNVNGGFGGGPSQFPHVATTYAAVNSLCMIGTPKAYRAIDRDSLVKFLFSVRQEDGSFRMQVDGEIDVRGAYCAVSCAKLTNVPAATLAKLFEKTGDWIASCQTYEGGFGGTPDLEAHGGYTFCGIAALALLNEGHKCDTLRLLKWSIMRQMRFEGGFQGRTNKLVDGCYSFWVGATVHITQAVIANEGISLTQSVYDCYALQEYILLCCQKQSGGLIDKPGKPQDLYHTCYTLSGVAVAQHCESTMYPQVLGGPDNELLPTHPLFNVSPRAVASALHHFEQINNDASETKSFSSNGEWDRPRESSAVSSETTETTDTTESIGDGEEPQTMPSSRSSSNSY